MSSIAVPTNLRARYPALCRLGLGEEEFAALERQGFVAAEPRRGKVIFKLRFRLHGRQIARYLGSDPALADEVKQELRDLQSARRSELKLQHLMVKANLTLRSSKQQLLLNLTKVGRYFHGYAIRKRRTPPVDKRDC